ncbi:hypothetical protein AHF37_04924 [Paragonimus kellicotti]|nr:hypothetical protein AHF37_04924 [Paragonimus kellicotti]
MIRHSRLLGWIVGFSLYKSQNSLLLPKSPFFSFKTSGTQRFPLCNDHGINRKFNWVSQYLSQTKRKLISGNKSLTHLQYSGCSSFRCSHI